MVGFYVLTAGEPDKNLANQQSHDMLAFKCWFSY